MTKKRHLLFLVLILLVSAFLRFYNLLHDAPYFFNPDERNMAAAVTRFSFPAKLSDIPGCIFSQLSASNPQSLPATCNLNPRFFAYGQFPLYLAYASDQIANYFGGNLSFQKAEIKSSFPSAIFWLRFWSATASTATVFLVFLISRQIFSLRPSSSNDFYLALLASILTMFTPGLIQSAHFGTTESFLAFFFLASFYFSIKLLKQPIDYKFAALASGSLGLALGSKLTGIFFSTPLFLSLTIQFAKQYYKTKKKRLIMQYSSCVLLSFVLIISVFIISSPYNLIDFAGFKGSVFGYEADVALGRFQAFYTRQFIDTVPIMFQLEKIFPYAVGWPIFILGTTGFLLMIISLIFKSTPSISKSIKHKALSINKKKRPFHMLNSYCLVLTVSFLIYFLPNAFLFAKWTRFMTPIFPFFAIFSGYTLMLFIKKLSVWPKRSTAGKTASFFLAATLVFISVLPGAAFISTYAREDVRLTASRWIYQNIETGSYLLFDTGNVVDIPLGIPQKNTAVKNYKMVSFDFYHLDGNNYLFQKLINHLQKTDYIFVPSRRIFMNHLKFPNRYPLTAKYYRLLFSGRLGFEKIAEFSSFPTLQIGSLNLEFDDEMAEETFTVFDHPVVRIYKKIHSYSQIEYENMFRKT